MCVCVCEREREREREREGGITLTFTDLSAKAHCCKENCGGGKWRNCHRTSVRSLFNLSLSH